MIRCLGLYFSLTPSIISKCYLFVDDVKIIFSSSDMERLSEDLRGITLWTKTWDMQLSVAKCLHMHLGRGPAPLLEMEGIMGTIESLPQVG